MNGGCLTLSVRQSLFFGGVNYNPPENHTPLQKRFTPRSYFFFIVKKVTSTPPPLFVYPDACIPTCRGLSGIAGIRRGEAMSGGHRGKGAGRYARHQSQKSKGGMRCNSPASPARRGGGKGAGWYARHQPQW